MATRDSYDTTPYQSNPFAQSHPDRMAVVAALFGLASSPVEHCRVLELGCSSGGNLIPLAGTLPGSEFVGIERSWVQASAGQAMVQAMGLRNVSIRHMDLMAVDESLGLFDYIIAHGLYSWVPAEVRERTMQLCSRHLTPNGVAYVSYNVLPGWHFRSVARDLMLFHAGGYENPQERAAQARAVLDVFAQNVPKATTLGTFLAAESDAMHKEPDYYLLHEHLEGCNHAVYFHQFIEHAAEHGLQYLGEAEFFMMLVNQLPRPMSDAICQMTSDIIATEQWMDFYRNRCFRQTLLCRDDRPLVRIVEPQLMRTLWLSTGLQEEGESDGWVSFGAFRGGAYKTPAPATQAAFRHLGEQWPQPMRFDDLLRGAADKLGRPLSDAEAEVLTHDLLVAYEGDLLLLQSFRVPLVSTVSDRPQVSAVVRFQAQATDRVTNQLHESCTLDAVQRFLVGLLDGSRDQAGLARALVEAVESGAVTLQQDGPDEVLNKKCRTAVRVALQGLAKAALLVA